RRLLDVAAGRFRVHSFLYYKAANSAVVDVLRAHACEWNEKVSEELAKRGDLEVLQYVVRGGCAWNEWTCRAALRSDNLCVLQWATENGCPGGKEISEQLTKPRTVTAPTAPTAPTSKQRVPDEDEETLS